MYTRFHRQKLLFFFLDKLNFFNVIKVCHEINQNMCIFFIKKKTKPFRFNEITPIFYYFSPAFFVLAACLYACKTSISLFYISESKMRELGTATVEKTISEITKRKKKLVRHKDSSDKRRSGRPKVCSG